MRFLSVAAVSLALAGAAVGSLALAGAAVAADRPAPPLVGVDPVTGKRVSLATYAGRRVVLNFWASWCYPCRREAGALNAFARAHADVQVVGVDVNDSKRGARAFYRRYGVHHPTVFDGHALLATRFRIQGLPTTLVLDRRHRIVAVVQGEASLERLDSALRAAS